MKKRASKKIRVGIIGSGSAAACHARALLSNRSFRLTGVASRNVRISAEIATRFGAQTYPQPRALISDPAIDALILAVPPAAQPGYLRLALQRGMAVLCEKPLAPSVTTAKKTLKDLRNKSSAAGINFCYRLVPEIQWFRKCLQKKVCGVPWQVQVDWILGNRLGMNHQKLSPWKKSNHLGGGVLMNYGIHVLDYLFAGFPQPLLAGSDWHSLGNRKAIESGSMIWRLPGGSVVIRLSLITRQNPVHRIRLEGPLGSIEVKNFSKNNPAGPFRISSFGVSRLPKRPSTRSACLSDLFNSVHFQWQRSIEKKSTRLPTLEEGLSALVLAKKAFSR